MKPLDLFWDLCEGSIRFGVNDCCMVVADVVLAAGGPDLMAGYRGRYRTARGFVRAFRREGHQTLRVACETAFSTNGRECFDAADFDVIISDIGMPDVDGYEFLRRARALPQLREKRVPAIALTAFARTEDRTRALQAGYLVHVAKPVEAVELVATVASVAGRT